MKNVNIDPQSMNRQWKVEAKLKQPKVQKREYSDEDRVDLSTQLKDLLVSSKVPQKIQNSSQKIASKVLELIPQKAINTEDRLAQADLVHQGTFFISGFKLKLLNEFNGIKQMADNIDNGRHFSWKEKDLIIEKIKMLPKNVPVILVGHGMGADSAVEIAQKLDELKVEKDIDLLVTIDSVGLNNDIIPQNVLLNKNFIGNQDLFLNDSPNMAKDESKTLIENFIIDEVHENLDDTWTVQRQIYESIDEVLENFER